MRAEARTGQRIALTLADLRGLTRLGFDATLGVTDLVEQVHGTIGERVVPLGRARTGRTRGITRVVYGTIRGTTRLLSRGVDASLRLLEPAGGEARLSPVREAALAVINGVWGDHLESSGNPLAIPMSLRVGGRRIEPTDVGLKAAFMGASRYG